MAISNREEAFMYGTEQLTGASAVPPTAAELAAADERWERRGPFARLVRVAAKRPEGERR
jgi:hypothetical protein